LQRRKAPFGGAVVTFSILAVGSFAGAVTPAAPKLVDYEASFARGFPGSANEHRIADWSLYTALVTGDVVAPELVTKVKPGYPEVARRARLEGKVFLQAIINEKGEVEDVQVLSAANPIFQQPAIDAVKQWKYRPAKQNGRPVKVYFTVVVDFRLE